jgi:hypothetical protein
MLLFLTGLQKSHKKGKEPGQAGKLGRSNTPHMFSSLVFVTMCIEFSNPTMYWKLAGREEYQWIVMATLLLPEWDSEVTQRRTALRWPKCRCQTALQASSCNKFIYREKQVGCIDFLLWVIWQILDISQGLEKEWLCHLAVQCAEAGELHR